MTSTSFDADVEEAILALPLEDKPRPRCQRIGVSGSRVSGISPQGSHDGANPPRPNTWGSLGITTAEPRLGWTPPQGTVRQTAYQLKASNGWDTGRVESAAHGGIPYSGPALSSRDRFEWQVRTWNTGTEHWH